MKLNNINSHSIPKEDNKKILQSIENVEEQNKKIDTLKEKEIKQQSKEKIQAEIMSHFIQNPNENITLGMTISKDPKDGCEIIDFGNAQYEDEHLNSLFNGTIGKRVGGIQIKADETGEKEEVFEKELAIDKKTGIRGMLFVGKKGFKIDKVEFEDINKYDVPYEAYFAYKKDGNTYIKTIKNESLTTDFKIEDSEISGTMKFGTEGLKSINPEMVKQMQEQLVNTLKESKNNGTLDITIDTLLSQMPLEKEVKNILKDELYKLAES